MGADVALEDMEDEATHRLTLDNFIDAIVQEAKERGRTVEFLIDNPMSASLSVCRISHNP